MTQPLSFTDQLRAVIEAFTAASDLSVSTLSWRALGEAKALPLFMSGKSSLTLPRAERALAWLAGNWPPSAIWPASVPRPDLAAAPTSPAAEPAPAPPASVSPRAASAGAGADGGAA